MVEPSTVSLLPNLVREGALPASCGKRIRDDNPLDPLQAAVAKIVKGEPTKPGAYPWQVIEIKLLPLPKLYRRKLNYLLQLIDTKQVGVRVKGSARSDSIHWCGASIISEHFIITAAHCMEDFAKGLYVLRVGDYNTEV